MNNAIASRLPEKRLSRQSRLTSCLTAAGLLVIAACQNGPVLPTGAELRCPASGTVTLDGKPLSDAQISFVSVEKGSPERATTAIRDGKFRFDAALGPLPGRNRVSVVPQELEEGEALARAKSSGGRPVNFDKVSIPARYQVNSNLTADISLSGANDQLRFDLESK